MLAYNYFNQVENSVDPVHGSFVHRDSQYGDAGFEQIPHITANETEYGLALPNERDNGTLRVTHLIMPTTLLIAVFPNDRESGWRDFLLWRVPISDQSFQTFFVLCADVSGEAAQRYLAQPHRYAAFAHDPTIGEIGETVLRGDLRLEDLEDRRRIVALQDYVSQKGQGAIADRRHERLGRSDAGVILLRRIWERELRALAEGRPLTEWRVPERLTPMPSGPPLAAAGGAVGKPALSC